jgi:hypothetical protein
MLIPVFGSSPTLLSTKQDSARRLILGELNGVGLEWRSVGQTDYPSSFPLREVLTLAKHCAGGVILGFSQFESMRGISKKGTVEEKRSEQRLVFPTPWNQIEAGILFALAKPLLVFRENEIAGGIFDNGVSDVFIQQMPDGLLRGKRRKAFREVLQKFASEVHANYYAR